MLETHALRRKGPGGGDVLGAAVDDDGTSRPGNRRRRARSVRGNSPPPTTAMRGAAGSGGSRRRKATSWRSSMNRCKSAERRTQRSSPSRDSASSQRSTAGQRLVGASPRARLGNSRPVGAGPGVVFGVVAVVEEQQVVQTGRNDWSCPRRVRSSRAASTGRGRGRSRARRRSGRTSRGPRRQRRPQGQHQRRLSAAICRSKPQPPGGARVVRQVPVAPDRLRDAEQDAQVQGEQRVEHSASGRTAGG